MLFGYSIINRNEDKHYWKDHLLLNTVLRNTGAHQGIRASQEAERVGESMRGTLMWLPWN